jgi:hypothetical protein
MLYFSLITVNSLWSKTMRIELSDEVVAKLKPRNQKFDATAVGFPGFGVRVHPTGVKTFFYRYRLNGTVRMMRLGRTSYLPLGAALIKYRRARNQRLQGIDPQGRHPTTEEALHVLFEMWISYDTTGGLPEALSGTPSEQDFAAYYGVTVAAIRKLAAFGYLSVVERGDSRVVVPLHLAIRRVGEGDIRLF